ncbi:LysR family transcriptional regulator [Puniceibacterium sp. IMCC21224]|uniref:LysR family transcriptional regulator n=1 Tax=Puniceibacterium sp. IMCC21224 TaxID=1618204 RepID=UPI00065D938A|nr:LysR family transcriptional regulator [Puniceibacterium sp. IMCC21224]KMK64762.1 transcriptional regulator [Puniceibacterium sp. IMCC21224]
MRVSLDDLQAFTTVARVKSFARAATELAISQSAISRRIKKLEEELGTRLFDRTTRQVTVSAVGLQFLPEAERILHDYSRSLRDMRDLVNVRRGFVSFASNMTVSETLLPEIVAGLRATNPGVRVRISEGSSPQARERVLRGEAELAISQFGNGHPELEFEPLLEDRFVLISHRDHELASAPDLAWSDLEGHDFIRMRPGSGTISLLERSLGSGWDRLSGTLEVGHFHALMAMVGKNLGISAVPTLMQFRRLDLNLVATPISNPVVSRSLGLVTLKGRTLSPAAEALRQSCRTVLDQSVSLRLRKIAHDLESPPKPKAPRPSGKPPAKTKKRKKE